MGRHHKAEIKQFAVATQRACQLHRRSGFQGVIDVLEHEAPPHVEAGVDQLPVGEALTPDHARGWQCALEIPFICYLFSSDC